MASIGVSTMVLMGSKKKYVALAVLGRNIQQLGLKLRQQQNRLKIISTPGKGRMRPTAKVGRRGDEDNTVVEFIYVELASAFRLFHLLPATAHYSYRTYAHVLVITWSFSHCWFDPVRIFLSMTILLKQIKQFTNEKTAIATGKHLLVIRQVCQNLFGKFNNTIACIGVTTSKPAQQYFFGLSTDKKPESYWKFRKFAFKEYRCPASDCRQLMHEKLNSTCGMLNF